MYYYYIFSGMYPGSYLCINYIVLRYTAVVVAIVSPTPFSVFAGNDRGRGNNILTTLESLTQYNTNGLQEILS